MIEVLVAIIGGAGLIAVALISNRTRQHAKATRAQVENDHTTNLREEGDDRHRELVHRLEGLASDIRGLRRDVGRLTDTDHDHEKRIDDLERTQPPKEKP